MMKRHLQRKESTVVIVRNMLDIPRTTGTVRDSLIVYPISGLLVVVQVKSGRLQIRILKLAGTKLIAMKLIMKSSSIFKDLTAGMKVDLCCYMGSASAISG